MTVGRFECGYRIRVVDESDEAQARVFLAMLAEEIVAVSALLEADEQVGDEQVGDERARSRKKQLYELHRQSDALRRRFPGAAGP